MTNYEVMKKLNVEQMCDVLFALVKPYYMGDEEGEKRMKKKIMIFLLSDAPNPN